jgi:hypothetical protein
MGEAQHFYSVFGLTLACDRRLPLLAAAVGGADLVLREGRLAAERQPPLLLHDVAAEGVHQPRLRVEQWGDETAIEYGDFRAWWDGRSAHLSYETGTIAPENVPTVFTRVVLPLVALLRSSKTIALHGSAAVLGGAAWIFVGPSGAGKSTVVRAVIERAGLLLSDDFTLVDVSCVQALPGPPEVRLWDAVEGLSRHEGSVPETGKRWYLLEEARLAPSPVPVRGIVHLCPDDSHRGTHVDSVTGAGAFEMLLANTFDLSEASADRRERRFRQAASLVANVPTFACRYRKDRSRMAEHFDRVLDVLSTASGAIR